MEMPRVILLDEDNNYRLNLSDYLRANGFSVVEITAIDGDFIENSSLEWSILLINFGDNSNSGLEFLKTSTHRRLGSVLVLTDSDDPIDRIICLELGADDCISKSTHPREILARIRVAARRKPSVALAAKSFTPPAELAAPDLPRPAWRFSRETRELIAPEDQPIDLTADQFSLLDVLIQHTGTALSRDFLSQTLFGRTLKVGDRSIDNLVVRLRRRLGESARAPRLIRTARAGGYFFAGFPNAMDIGSLQLPH